MTNRDHIDRPTEGMMIMAATALTTAQVADALDTTPRTLRKFLRSDASGIESVGKGSRYSITAGQVKSLRSKFNKWNEANAPKVDATPDAPEEITTADETITEPITA